MNFCRAAKSTIFSATPSISLRDIHPLVRSDMSLTGIGRNSLTRAGFVQKYLDAGVRLCANIKPCLLRDHPRFEEAAAKGLLVRDEDGEPTMVQFWDELGAYLDFTNPSTRGMVEGRCL